MASQQGVDFKAVIQQILLPRQQNKNESWPMLAKNGY
jgi:hypothetical protein